MLDSTKKISLIPFYHGVFEALSNQNKTESLIDPLKEYIMQLESINAIEGILIVLPLLAAELDNSKIITKIVEKFDINEEVINNIETKIQDNVNYTLTLEDKTYSIIGSKLKAALIELNKIFLVAQNEFIKALNNNKQLFEYLVRNLNTTIDHIRSDFYISFVLKSEYYKTGALVNKESLISDIIYYASKVAIEAGAYWITNPDNQIHFNNIKEFAHEIKPPINIHNTQTSNPTDTHAYDTIQKKFEEQIGKDAQLPDIAKQFPEIKHVVYHYKHHPEIVKHVIEHHKELQNIKLLDDPEKNALLLGALASLNTILMVKWIKYLNENKENIKLMSKLGLSAFSIALFFLIMFATNFRNLGEAIHAPNLHDILNNPNATSGEKLLALGTIGILLISVFMVAISIGATSYATYETAKQKGFTIGKLISKLKK